MKVLAIALLLAVAVSGAVGVAVEPECPVREVRSYHAGVSQPITVTSEGLCACLEMECDEDFDPACVNYEFKKNFPSGSSSGGDISHVHFSYNVQTEEFGSKVEIDRKNGQLSNSAWLVISEGPNPKGHARELAIFYIDCLNLDGDGKGKVTAYAYSGSNNSNSWKLDPNTPFNRDADGNLLNIKATCDLTDNNNHISMEFTYPVRHINNYNDVNPNWDDWKGVRFAEDIGIWLHPAVATAMEYDADGSLSEYSINRQSYYDGNFLSAQCVPLP